MRAITWAVGLALVLAVALGLTQARAEEETYDLRGPGPQKGQTTVSRTTFKIKDATLTLKIADMEVTGKQTLTSTEEEQVTVLAVEGRQVKKAQTRVSREQLETETTLGDDKTTEKETGDLEGEVIISERTGPGKWKHLLVDSKPTAKQKEELDKRIGPENEDELYPEGKVKIGHTWIADATALQRVLGGSITDLKGKLTMKLLKKETVDGELCAVIEAAGTITGLMKEDGETIKVELQAKGTTWRSLKTGVDVKDRTEGKIKMSGKQDADGQKVDFTLAGPFTIDSRAKRK